MDMGSNSKSGKQIPMRKKHMRRMLIFAVPIAAVYGAVFILAPDKAIEALGRSGKIFLSIAVPIALEKKSFKSRSGSSAMIM